VVEIAFQENFNVNVPSLPVIARPEKVATPETSCAVALLNVPVPEANVALTVPDALVTVFPELSSTATTGWVESALPLVATVAGAVVRTSCDAVPEAPALEEIANAAPDSNRRDAMLAARSRRHA
jgi:hypothetical protein